MKVLLRTADELECLVDVPKFTPEIRRPIIKEVRIKDTVGYTVTHIRIYFYHATRLVDDMPIYKEVLG